MSATLTQRCSFCGLLRAPDRIIGGQTGALICDDCAGLCAMVFLRRRDEVRERGRRLREGTASWSAWSTETAGGIPIIHTAESRS